MKSQTVVPALLTLSAYAAHRGVGPSAVSNYRKQGLLVFAEGADSKTYVDVARSDARLNAKLDPLRGRPKKAVDAPLFDPPEQPAQAVPARTDRLGDVRTDLLEQQAIAARMKNAAMARTLVAVQDYERRSQEVGRLARERVNSVIRALAERLAAERDPRQITTLLSGEIDKAFEELADQVESGVLTEVDDTALIEETETVADADPAEELDAD